MRTPLLLFAAALCACPAHAQRFGGGAKLTQAVQQSADQRFEASTVLLPADTLSADEKKLAGQSTATQAPVRQQGGRFGLSANLVNTNAPLACTTGGDNIFKNGFE
jgi:hypothetical protein